MLGKITQWGLSRNYSSAEYNFWMALTDTHKGLTDVSKIPSFVQVLLCTGGILVAGQPLQADCEIDIRSIFREHEGFVCWNNDPCEPSPLTFSLTQTVDYGTSNALPIGLTPANTLVQPIVGGAPGILTDGLANLLGLSDNLSILFPPTPDVPTRGFFQDDFSFQTRAAVQFQEQVGEKGIFTTGYAYNQRLFASIEQLDLLQHAFTAQYAHSLSDEWTAAGTYGFNYYFLENDSFLDQNTAALALGYRPQTEWYIENGVSYGYSHFFGANFLNSHLTGYNLKLIRYLGTAQQSNLNAGYSIGYSDAEFEGFSYLANSVYVGGRYALDQQSRDTFDVTFSYADYNFRGTDPIDTAVQRLDNIYSLAFVYTHKLTDNWLTFASYTLLDSQSNVSRQDYTSSLISVGVTYTR